MALGLRLSADNRCASSQYLLPDENHPLQENAIRVRARAIRRLYFCRRRKHRKQLRSLCTILAPAPDLLHNERDNNEQRVENPDAHRCRLIGQWRARHIRVANLDDDQANSKADYRRFANCRHHIPREIKNYPASKERDLQCKFRVAVVPETKTNFPSVIVDREIARMRNEVENPMREDRCADDQSCRSPVEAAVSAANGLINKSGNQRPRERGDQAV